MLQALRAEDLHKLFGIIPYKLLVCFLQSIFLLSVIYLHQYDLLDVCFLLWLITHYYLIYVFMSVTPLLAIRHTFSEIHNPLKYLFLLVIGFYWTPYCLLIQENVTGLPGVFLASYLRPRSSPLFLTLENWIRNKCLDAGMLIVTEASSHLGSIRSPPSYLYMSIPFYPYLSECILPAISSLWHQYLAPRSILTLPPCLVITWLSNNRKPDSYYLNSLTSC